MCRGVELPQIPKPLDIQESPVCIIPERAESKCDARKLQISPARPETRIGEGRH